MLFDTVSCFYGFWYNDEATIGFSVLASTEYDYCFFIFALLVISN